MCAIDTTKRGHPNYSRNTHYDVSAWYVSEAERLGIISLHFIPGSENPADMLTKVMPIINRLKYTSMMMGMGPVGSHEGDDNP